MHFLSAAAKRRGTIAREADLQVLSALQVLKLAEEGMGRLGGKD
jgi:hypothetical protein